jgi:hypothetical protein
VLDLSIAKPPRLPELLLTILNRRGRMGRQRLPLYTISNERVHLNPDDCCR